MFHKFERKYRERKEEKNNGCINFNLGTVSQIQVSNMNDRNLEIPLGNSYNHKRYR